ncbi:hypothetical protein AI2602V1_3533 [Citrobacter freundii]|uniref:hypothetical protein n=1 Tax=Citrobacter freundii TaxID=546 RepID=UPI001DF31CCF|nr:hypothetical protein [Citrobacter freundii]MDT7240171.1 hypothetical protein [Citrobacter freundii]CAE6159159.1 hypothetical protein AI2602V1_3533 [Citrobacter freundii]CAH3352149.1 hypothetical protein AI2602V1_3533 [Citrobacter freundii]CAH5960688.1 hypothetical protein AI3058V1_0661 [Citrobacter freundii]HBK3068662.1 hypothetical protein [Citrobacter freundii]
MTPEQDNAVRAQGRKCVAEIQQAMKCRPKPKWNAVVPPIIKKHHQKISPLGISLVAFVSSIGRMQGRYGVES